MVSGSLKLTFNLFSVSHKTSNSISSYGLFMVEICAAVVVLAFLKFLAFVKNLFFFFSIQN